MCACFISLCLAVLSVCKGLFGHNISLFIFFILNYSIWNMQVSNLRRNNFILLHAVFSCLTQSDTNCTSSVFTHFKADCNVHLFTAVMLWTISDRQRCQTSTVTHEIREKYLSRSRAELQNSLTLSAPAVSVSCSNLLYFYIPHTLFISLNVGFFLIILVTWIVFIFTSEGNCFHHLCHGF